MSICWQFLFIILYILHWIDVVFPSFHSYSAQIVESVFCIFITANSVHRVYHFIVNTPTEFLWTSCPIHQQLYYSALKLSNQNAWIKIRSRFVLFHSLALIIHCVVMSLCEMGLCYTKSSRRHGTLAEMFLIKFS